MTEKILDIIKNLNAIVEKHLIPAILSFVIGIGVYLYVGESFWMVTQLTTTIFVIFIACIAFLAISLIMWLAAKFKSWRIAQSNEKYNQKQEEKQREEDDNKLRAYFDTLPNEIIDITKQLLANNNTPIEVELYKINEQDFMYTPGYSRQGLGTFQTDLLICKTQRLSNKHLCYKVVMQDNAFNTAKYLVQKYGKLTSYDF